MNRILWIAVLSLFTLGCERSNPTFIAMLNNSGKILRGEVSVGKEKAPFYHLSSHGGLEAFKGNEPIFITVTDIWKSETYFLRGTVPEAPIDNGHHSLLIEIQKDQTLRVTWKSDSIGLLEKHFQYLRANFDGLPIIIFNECEEQDCIIYSRQDRFTHRYYNSSQSRGDNVLTYGFLHQGTTNAGTIMVSRVEDDILQTRYFQLSQNLRVDFPNTTAVYVHLAKDNAEAEVYFLNGTPDDPWLVTQQLLEKKIQLPLVGLKVPVFKTEREMRIGLIRLPDPEGIP